LISNQNEEIAIIDKSIKLSQISSLGCPYCTFIGGQEEVAPLAEARPPASAFSFPNSPYSQNKNDKTPLLRSSILSTQTT
jgi:hypothetical protein